MKFLILSSSFGDGHSKAAKAIRSYIEKIDKTSEIITIGPDEYIGPIYDRISMNFYLNIIKIAPRLYSGLFKMADEYDMPKNIIKIFQKIFNFKLKKLIKDFNPDFIICTHPFPLQYVATIKNNLPKKIKIISIITDFCAHNIYLYPETDMYIVGSKFLKSKFVERGIKQEKISPIGIPIDSAFLKKEDKKEIRKKLNLPNKTTIMIMGGGFGFGKIKEMVLSLMENKNDLEILVITGNNKKLKKDLEILVSEKQKNNFIIYGYSNQIPELMSVSDFLITKPGGLTLSEALAKNTTIITYSPLPGQEEYNSDFLQKFGAAYSLENCLDINSVLDNLINNKALLEKLKKSAKKMAPNSNYKKIINEIIKNT